MLDLIFWTFAVAGLPIALALTVRFLTLIASPFHPPAAPHFVLPGHAYHGVHHSRPGVGRLKGWDDER